MKRTVLAMAVGVVGGLAALTSAQGQGLIQLDNYASSGNLVSYLGSPIGTGYTVGLYWVAGSVVGSIANDPSGTADPATLGGGLQLATGPNSTTPTSGGGYFSATGNFQLTGVSAGQQATFEVIAYNGASYSAATIRGHSGAFAMAVGSGSPTVQVGLGMPAFSCFTVAAVPEPATFALAGLGGLSLLLFRRRK